MSPELRHEKQEVLPEAQNPGNNLFENIRNAARNRLAIAGIGFVAALGANELANNQNDAIASTEASVLSLKQECVKAGLRYKVIEAEMNNPGDKKLQSIEAVVRYFPMPEQCHGTFKRSGRAKLQIEDADNPNHWISTGPTKKLIYKTEVNDGGLGATGFGFFGKTPRDGSKLIYSCTPGSDKTGVRGIFVHRVKNLMTGRIAAKKVDKVPFKVKRTKMTSEKKKRGALPGAC